VHSFVGHLDTSQSATSAPRRTTCYLPPERQPSVTYRHHFFRLDRSFLFSTLLSGHTTPHPYPVSLHIFTPPLPRPASLQTVGLHILTRGGSSHTRSHLVSPRHIFAPLYKSHFRLCSHSSYNPSLSVRYQDIRSPDPCYSRYSRTLYSLLGTSLLHNTDLGGSPPITVSLLYTCLFTPCILSSSIKHPHHRRLIACLLSTPDLLDPRSTRIYFFPSLSVVTSGIDSVYTSFRTCPIHDLDRCTAILTITQE
jgi:hypothetical protein